MIPRTDVKFELGWAYFVLVLFMLIGGSNAVNLTDGLDGLLSGTAAIAFGAFSIIAVAQEQFGVAIFCMAVVGRCTWILVFNANPAKSVYGRYRFIGFRWSHCSCSNFIKTRIATCNHCGVFVMETLSVIIQVISFKTTGKRGL